MPRGTKNVNNIKCIACDCIPTEKGLSFYTLPKDEDLRQKWIQCIPFFKERPTAKICSKHFLPEDFERDMRNEFLGLPLRNILKRGSCPMIGKPKTVIVEKKSLIEKSIVSRSSEVEKNEGPSIEKALPLKKDPRYIFKAINI